MPHNKFHQETFDFPVKSLLGREDFFVAPSNMSAVRLIENVSPAFPALLIFGGSGSGKTHLAHLFCDVVFEKFSEKAFFMETLSLSFVETALRTSRFIGLEDVKAPVEEEALFHLMNGVKNQGGVLLMTSLTNYPSWGIKLADLLSRLSAVQSAQLGFPDDSLMTAVWVKLFAERGVGISPEAVSYLLKNTERSFVFARRLAQAADKKALSEKRAVTVPLLKDVLKEIGTSDPSEKRE